MSERPYPGRWRELTTLNLSIILIKIEVIALFSLSLSFLITLLFSTAYFPCYPTYENHVLITMVDMFYGYQRCQEKPFIGSTSKMHHKYLIWHDHTNIYFKPPFLIVSLYIL